MANNLGYMRLHKVRDKAVFFHLIGEWCVFWITYMFADDLIMLSRMKSRLDRMLEYVLGNMVSGGDSNLIY